MWKTIFDSISRVDNKVVAGSVGCVKVMQKGDGGAVRVILDSMYGADGVSIKVSVYWLTTSGMRIRELGDIEIENARGDGTFYLDEMCDGVVIGDYSDKQHLMIASFEGSIEDFLNENEVEEEQEEEFEEPAIEEPDIEEPAIEEATREESKPEEAREAETGIEENVVSKQDTEGKVSTVDIFCDDEFISCREVDPAEVAKVAGNHIRLAGNSFAMHAFYKYGHLLLAKSGDIKKPDAIIVGAPGVYSNSERCLAMMYGLSNFKYSCRKDVKEPNFGYWYAEIYI